MRVCCEAVGACARACTLVCFCVSTCVRGRAAVGGCLGCALHSPVCGRVGERTCVLGDQKALCAVLGGFLRPYAHPGSSLYALLPLSSASLHSTAFTSPALSEGAIGGQGCHTQCGRPGWPAWWCDSST